MPGCPCSGRGSIVVVQHAAHTLTTLNRSCVSEVVPLRLDKSVAQALVIAFIAIVGDEVLDSCPQRTFTEQDEPFLMLRTNFSA
jgi:hypothetical protein